MGRRQVASIDQLIGKRIRERRIMLGLTRAELAQRSGAAGEQMIYKYERAAASVSAGRLYAIADSLGVPIEYFFDDLGLPEAPPLPRRVLSFMRIVSEVESEAHRQAISHLVRALAPSADNSDSADALAGENVEAITAKRS